MEYVLFFPNEVNCLLCKKATFGVVEENSGTIKCTECDAVIFDASDCAGTVVILELNSETEH